jgi:hypothetical protein
VGRLLLRGLAYFSGSGGWMWVWNPTVVWHDDVGGGRVGPGVFERCVYLWV